ncbi:hypothetical protein [Streptomyces sp. NPDC006132]|uniref:hypothetical protein n=1 Tax=Streptomyces sp. NPDC006132 TaxID=3156732 RepID=UPI0033EF39AF
MLERALEDGVRFMESQADDLVGLRSRSMQLLQVMLVAESIAFSVLLGRGVTLEPWAVAMLLGALAATLGVAVYVAHPVPDWEVPGEMALGAKAYREGVGLQSHLEKLIEEMEDGTQHNNEVLMKRFRAFEWLLYFLVVLLLVALITYLATH